MYNKHLQSSESRVGGFVVESWRCVALALNQLHRHGHGHGHSQAQGLVMSATATGTRRPD